MVMVVMMLMMINDDPFFIHLLQESFVQTSVPFPFFPARICFPSASPQSSSGSESPQVWGLFPFSSGSSEPGDRKCTLEPSPKFPVEFHILFLPNFILFYSIFWITCSRLFPHGELRCPHSQRRSQVHRGVPHSEG